MIIEQDIMMKLGMIENFKINVLEWYRAYETMKILDFHN